MAWPWGMRAAGQLGVPYLSRGEAPTTHAAPAAPLTINAACEYTSILGSFPTGLRHAGVRCTREAVRRAGRRAGGRCRARFTVLDSSPMNCVSCGYLLFNLEQPVCPECGRGFEVAWYRFEPGDVAFTCPHCAQTYFGNDAQGLPSPRAFECVKCHRSVSLREMRVVPQRGDAIGTRVDASPWDDRRRLGLWRAWWRTATMTLVRPAALFRRHSGTSIKEAWYFAMMTLYIGYVPYAVFQMGLYAAIGTAITRSGVGGPGGAVPGMLPVSIMALIYVPMALVGPLIAPFIGSAIASIYIQPALWLLVPNRRSMECTFRTAMYSMGPGFLIAVPICGNPVASVWCMVTLTIGIKEVHGTTGWRAAIAVLWLPIALIGVYIVVIIGVIAMSLRSAGV